MRLNIKNQFLINYIVMFFISTMIAIFAFILMDFASDVVAKTLLKNQYTAETLMQEDYRSIDTERVVSLGGGVQVVNSSYEIVLSEGVNSFKSNRLTASEFTDFLTSTNSKGVPYSYSVEYNENNGFWLIVTFPTSIRIDFSVVRNKEIPSQDMKNVATVIIATVLFYLILLTLSTIIYSKITSLSIVNPLKKLYSSVKSLREGDYSARVDLGLQNEFGEFEEIFNEMAQRIESEISLRKEAEKHRKQLILDISHDLKNPLASIMGYSELCTGKADLDKEELNKYLRVIYENSRRANNLITDLFQLSKLESSEFRLRKENVELCEYIREVMGEYIPMLEDAGFSYNFDIPEEEISVLLDKNSMNRVFQNLITNAIQYNPKGTKIYLHVLQENSKIMIIFKDNGIGIPREISKNIFQPFLRVDTSRNSETGGTGLGLAIAEKIILAHEGEIELITDIDQGCHFIIKLPKN